VLGDRWTLLILRDCFMGVRRFEGFVASLGLSRAMAAQRLGALVEAGVLEKRAYSTAPPRHEYRLTAKGRALEGVLMVLADWGNRFESDEARPPIGHLHVDCGQPMRPVLACSACGEALEPGRVRMPALAAARAAQAAG
jgi:DNA-binding HxlR family transcriptional regulator